MGSALAGFHGPRLNRAQKSAILIVVASNVIDGYLNPPNDVVTVRCLVLPPGKGSFLFSEINPPGGDSSKCPRGRSLPYERYLPGECKFRRDSFHEPLANQTPLFLTSHEPPANHMSVFHEPQLSHAKIPEPQPLQTRSETARSSPDYSCSTSGGVFIGFFPFWQRSSRWRRSCGGVAGVPLGYPTDRFPTEAWQSDRNAVVATTTAVAHAGIVCWLHQLNFGGCKNCCCI